MDGAKGLAAVASFKPDLVLLDLMLPSIDGLTVLRTLRADPESAALPVIMFSNAFTGERLNDLWDAGATQVLAKAQQQPEAGGRGGARDARGPRRAESHPTLTSTPRVDIRCA